MAIINTTLAFILFFGVTACVILFFAKLLKYNVSFADCIKPYFAVAKTGDSKTALQQILNMLTFVPWAFVGFEIICFSTQDFKFQKKYLMSIMSVAIVCC